MNADTARIGPTNSGRQRIGVFTKASRGLEATTDTDKRGGAQARRGLGPQRAMRRRRKSQRTTENDRPTSSFDISAVADSTFGILRSSGEQGVHGGFPRIWSDHEDGQTDVERKARRRLRPQRAIRRRRKPQDGVERRPDFIIRYSVFDIGHSAFSVVAACRSVALFRLMVRDRGHAVHVPRHRLETVTDRGGLHGHTTGLEEDFRVWPAAVRRQA